MDDTLTFKIPKELKLNFNILALKEGKSMADIIRELIEEYIKTKN